MDNKRITQLSNNRIPIGSKCVVYVMMRDQRVSDNHALFAAQEQALNLELPLVVLFNVLPSSGHRSREQFEFMISGLKEVERKLGQKNIIFRLVCGEPKHNIISEVNRLMPAAIYFDFSPLKGPRKIQKSISKNLEIPCQVVDTHNIIPVRVLSDKEEFAAHTIRNKIHPMLEQWLKPPPEIKRHPFSGEKLKLSSDWGVAARQISKIDKSGVNSATESGEVAAQEMLVSFKAKRLESYAADRNDPSLDGQSNLSPYLHFGQISSLRVALSVIEEAPEPPLLFKKAKLASYDGQPTKMDSINTFLEELIVRKELSDNFCFYNSEYDSIQGARDWARQSLNDHRNDARPKLYSLKQFDSAQTHDDAWNAAQLQMRYTGKMHGYMRMYWAKKILEWSPAPEEAVQSAIYLNDRYSLDGGDPNGYVGILWSIAGVHDRPWFEREIYGKIRYMSRSGLDKKFEIEKYIRKWA